MMAAIWFTLAVLCAVGAGALVVIDRRRRDRARSERVQWARERGYQYTGFDEQLPARWSGAAMANLRYLPARDIVRGRRRGERFILLDVDDSATLVAVRRPHGSDVDVDLRPVNGTPPRSERLTLLGRFGDRVIFASDPEIARRVCDSRMAGFIDTIPAGMDLLWSEGAWTLGTIAFESDAQAWDNAIETVARLSGLLRVLPPAAGMVDAGPPARAVDADPAEPPAPERPVNYGRERPQRAPIASGGPPPGPVPGRHSDGREWQQNAQRPAVRPDRRAAGGPARREVTAAERPSPVERRPRSGTDPSDW